MQENNINCEDWFLVLGQADFDTFAFGYELGWYDDGIVTDNFPYKERKEKRIKGSGLNI